MQDADRRAGEGEQDPSPYTFSPVHLATCTTYAPSLAAPCNHAERATHLPLRLLALGRDGVHLIDEDDGGRVLLCLLEHLGQGGRNVGGWLG